MPRISLVAACLFLPSVFIVAQSAPQNPLAPYISISGPVIALAHVEVIDGTGASPLPDQTVVLDNGKITSIGPSTGTRPPSGARILDLHGRTVFPGLVGMHEHLFYPTPYGPQAHTPLYSEMADSAPRLYLAAGITTARTTGSMEPYTDLALRTAIDDGKIPGPDLDITGPYLEGPGSFAIQLHALSSAADATNTVNYWAGEGVTSFKAYMQIKPEELKAAIDAVHAHGLKITGHLCSIGFREAADIDIDNLEHGLVVDTEFYSGKKPGVCPGQGPPQQEMANDLDVAGPQVQATIQDLIAHHVAVTSTLAIFEPSVPNRPPMEKLHAVEQALTPAAWSQFLARRALISEHASTSIWPVLLKKEMQFEREFVAAGGLLLAGCDPTGYGGVLPGFGDQRNLELLVEAGFTPVQAIHIYTQNGARFLRREDRIGTLAPGKRADLVVVVGDPAKDISDIEHVETVFKNGVGYDPQKLIDSVRGMVGIR